MRRSLGSAGLWRPVLRAAALAAGAYGFLVFVIAPLTGHFNGEFEDFNAYLGAAQASAAHGDIYGAFTQQSQNVALSGFDYPPLVALLVTPLAWMPLHTSQVVWLLTGVAATLTGAIIVCRALLLSTWPRLELAVLATFTYAPATYNFWHGQMNPLVFLLLALALREWVRGRELSCGAIIGAAAAIKLAPIVLLVLFVRRGWWKGIAMGAGVVALSLAAGVAAFGTHTMYEYAHSVLPVLSRDDGWLYNQSWNGVVNRLADHSVLVFQPSTLATRVPAPLLSAAGVIAAGWAVRRSVESTERRGAQFGAAVVAMLLAGTITWYAHDIHLLIPLAAAAALAAASRGAARLLWIASAVTLLATAVLAPLLIAAANMTAIVNASHRAFWWLLLQVASLPALACGALLASLVVALRSKAIAPSRAAQAAAA